MQAGQYYRRVILFMLITYVCGAAVLIAFGTWYLGAVGAVFSNSCPPSQPASVESLARFKLPPSARSLWSSCWGMQGWVAQARFEIAPDDVDTLLASSLVEAPLSPTERPAEFEFPGIEPEKITSFLYGSVNRPELELFQEILIDTSDPEQYTIYVTVLGG